MLDNSRDEDEDALIAELEAEDDLDHLREQRIQQLHSEFSRAKTVKELPGHGIYTEIKDETELLDITTSTTSPLCVVHFQKSDFNRCRIMNEKLAVLAEKHYETRFVSIDVDNAPFLVVKLGVKVLPCVICFKDGKSVDRIIGFEGIGYRPDDFTVQELEGRLLSCGVLPRARMTKEDNYRRAKKESKEREEEFDDDDDWD